MDGFLSSIAAGIGGLVIGSLTLIGQTLRGMIATLDHALPGGLLATAGLIYLVGRAEISTTLVLVALVRRTARSDPLDAYPSGRA